MTMSILMVSVVFMVIGMIVQGRLRSKFAQYSKMPVSGGLNGAEVAEKMLKDNGIFDVKITSVQGQLTDHYNPVNKTVNLSEDVYNGRSVAAKAERGESGRLHFCGAVHGQRGEGGGFGFNLAGVQGAGQRLGRVGFRCHGLGGCC